MHLQNKLNIRIIIKQLHIYNHFSNQVGVNYHRLCRMKLHYITADAHIFHHNISDNLKSVYVVAGAWRRVDEGLQVFITVKHFLILIWLNNWPVLVLTVIVLPA